VRRVAAVAAVLVLGLPAAAAAQCPKTSLADIEDEVMCPVCGTTLELASEAPQADRERELIQRLVADCRSKDQVKEVLVAEFGEEVLAVPDDEGFDLAAYLVPAVGILLAATALGFAALRWRRGRQDPRAGAPAQGSAGARIDEDMDRYEL
jgi:cytochrome c-type biogenesis protein CcmH/NrfF